MQTTHALFFVCGIVGGFFLTIIHDARTRVLTTMLVAGKEIMPDATAALDKMAWTSTGMSTNLLQ
jgi:hypothetical protein